MQDIPEAAVEAVAAEVYERTTVYMPQARQIAEAALRAALPHLLVDYRARLVDADRELTEARTAETDDQFARVRLAGKAQGVRLALSYFDETLRGA